MANIFISYADDRFKESLNRIARQAKGVGIFDKIIKYTPKDLPLHIKASPLFAFRKGGGYWLWKPYIIYHSLELCKIGDIIFYCDSGCTLDAKSQEWELWKELLKHHDALFFQYRDGYDYGWGVFPDKAAYKYWAKPSTANFFRRYADPALMEFDVFWGGLIVIKKTDRGSMIIDQWYKTMLFHPELVADAFGADMKDENHTYHTHDQALLTPLIYIHRNTDNCAILPETSESRIGQPAVLATRWMQGRMSLMNKIKYTVWRFLHNDK